MNPRLFLLLLGGSLFGLRCTPPPKSDPSDAAMASASAKQPMDPCEKLREEFQTLLGAATTHCSNDEDCSCGPGGIEPAGCGRIMNKQSAEKLYGAYSRFRQQCGLDLHCAPRRCLAACENGSCVERHERLEVQPILRPPVK